MKEKRKGRNFVWCEYLQILHPLAMEGTRRIRTNAVQRQRFQKAIATNRKFLRMLESTVSAQKMLQISRCSHRYYSSQSLMQSYYRLNNLFGIFEASTACFAAVVTSLIIALETSYFSLSASRHSPPLSKPQFFISSKSFNNIFPRVASVTKSQLSCQWIA